MLKDFDRLQKFGVDWFELNLELMDLESGKMDLWVAMRLEMVGG